MSPAEHPNHNDSMLALLAESEHDIYLPLRRLAAHEQWQEWRRFRLEQWQANPERFGCVLGAGRACGLVSWTPLEWDSRILEVPAGRLEPLVSKGTYEERRNVNRELIRFAVDGCWRAGIRHLTVRAAAEDLCAIHSLQEAGFELIDGIQTFEMPISDERLAKVASPGITIGLFESSQLPGIRNLARTAYRLDRFHADPELDRSKADQLHEEWLVNSCNGTVADAVFVARRDQQVLGFVTVKLDAELFKWTSVKLATIVLVAIAEEARGSGIGKAITAEALNWMRQKGVQLARVGTQLSNVAAGRLYEASGFRLTGVALTLRKMIGGNE